MKTLKRMIFSEWHFMRWLRLAMGLFIAYQAFELQNAILGVLAGLFIFQALANAGCCSTAGCPTVPGRKNTNDTSDVEFKEIKGNN